MNTPIDKDRERTDQERTDDKQFANRAKDLFDGSVERIDAATLSKLNQGRQAALAEVSSARPMHSVMRWMPASGLAAAAVLAVVMFRGPAVPVLPSETESTVSDFEILLGDDSLEMIEELEFYSWIDMAELDSLDNVG